MKSTEFKGKVKHVDNKKKICVVRAKLEDGSELDVFDVKLSGDILIAPGDDVLLSSRDPGENHLYSPPEDFDISLADPEVALTRNPYRTGTVMEIDSRLSHIVAYDHQAKEKVKIKRSDMNIDIQDLLIRDEINYWGDFDEEGNLVGYEAITQDNIKMAS